MIMMLIVIILLQVSSYDTPYPVLHAYSCDNSNVDYVCMLIGSRHIGGNAIFSMHPDFAAVVAAVDATTRDASRGDYIPYDIALYRYISRHPSIFAAYRHRLRYVDIIQNTYGRTLEVTQAILAGDLSTPPTPVHAATYLLVAGPQHIQPVLDVLIPHNQQRIAEQLAEDARADAARRDSQRYIHRSDHRGDDYYDDL
jgi:hypothetical protein